MNSSAGYRAVLAIAFACLITPTLARAMDRDVEAGPLWTDIHAQRNCPGVCSAAGAKTWTGEWHTTKPGRQSVCSCRFDGSGAALSSPKPAKRLRSDASGGPLIEVEARFGGLGNDSNAKANCPKICEEKGLSWAGKWVPVPNWTIRWTCSCR
jgi:Mannan-binding protein